MNSNVEVKSPLCVEMMVDDGGGVVMRGGKGFWEID